MRPCAGAVRGLVAIWLLMAATVAFASQSKLSAGPTALASPHDSLDFPRAIDVNRGNDVFIGFWTDFGQGVIGCSGRSMNDLGGGFG